LGVDSLSPLKNNIESNLTSFHKDLSFFSLVDYPPCDFLDDLIQQQNLDRPLCLGRPSFKGITKKMGLYSALGRPLTLLQVMSSTSGLIPYIKWLRIGISIPSRVLNLTL
jgi:hypothetical protein